MNAAATGTGFQRPSLSGGSECGSSGLMLLAALAGDASDREIVDCVYASYVKVGLRAIVCSLVFVQPR